MRLFFKTIPFLPQYMTFHMNSVFLFWRMACLHIIFQNSSKDFKIKLKSLINNSSEESNDQSHFLPKKINFIDFNSSLETIKKSKSSTSTQSCVTNMSHSSNFFETLTNLLKNSFKSQGTEY